MISSKQFKFEPLVMDIRTVEENSGIFCMNQNRLISGPFALMAIKDIRNIIKGLEERAQKSGNNKYKLPKYEPFLPL